MLKYSLFLIVGLFGVASSALTQMSSNDILFENFEFRKFINLHNNSVVNQKVNLQLAHSYYFLNDFENANLYFSKLDWNDANLALENHLIYANSLKNIAKIDDAKKEVLLFLTYNPKDKNALLLQKQIENYFKINDLPKAEIILHNLENINTAIAQFSPVYKDNKMFYVSENRNTTYEQSKIDYSESSDDLIYGKIVRPETGIYLTSEQKFSESSMKSFKKFNVGAICWSISDNCWLLTLTPKATNWSKINQYPSRIYSWKEGEESPKKLKIRGIKGDVGVGHPAISTDGKFIVFSLDKGSVGSDLYVSSKDSDLKWSKPKKLPEEVNSIKDEVFPFLEGDSVLYFSSDGKLGYGGLDIYKITFKNGNIEGKAQLLLKPFNTVSDDYSVCFKNASKTQGFITSDRENGVGDADIYFFDTKIPWKLDLKIQNENGETVANKIIQTKINGRDIEIKKSETGKFEKLELEPSSLVLLNFLHADSLINVEFRTPNTNGKDTTLIITVWNKKEKNDIVSDLKNNEILENQNLEIAKPKFSPIFFEFDKFSISKNYQQELKELINFMKENVDKTIIIIALADERGDVFYNLELSTKRAKEIYKFLIKNGINPQQIKLQSLGEAIYDEKCSPNCDESTHSKYRRADFEIR